MKDKKNKNIFHLLICSVAFICMILLMYRDQTRNANQIIGIWTNGDDSWAYGYQITFYEDGRVERHGYRNLEKGRYQIKGDVIDIDFDECFYDYNGYIPIEGYKTKYYYNSSKKQLERKEKREFVYVASLGQNNYFDNDDVLKPLTKQKEE